jgi:hypothetical protein
LVHPLFAFWSTFALADVTQGCIDSESVDPGAELRIPSELSQSPVDANKYLLHYFFGVRRPHNAGDQAKDSSLVAMVEELHRLAFATPTGVDQLSIVEL